MANEVQWSNWESLGKPKETELRRPFVQQNQDGRLEVFAPGLGGIFNIAQVALGDEIEIPTLEGEEKLKIPAGAQSGRVVRLRGKGVPHLNAHGRGDLQVRLLVQTPTELSDEQRRLLKQLAATFDRDVKPQENRGLFDKVKDVFGV